MDERLSGDVDPISATTGAVVRQLTFEHKQLSNWLHGLFLLFATFSTVLAAVAMMAGTWLPTLILLIGIAFAAYGIAIQSGKRSRLTERYNQQDVFLQAIPDQHRKPVSDYLELFTSGQMNIVDQTGTRIVLKGETSCYWLLASVGHMLSAYPSLRPVPEFEHPLRVEDPATARESAPSESAASNLKKLPKKGHSELYEPFVKPIAETDVHKRLRELRQLLGSVRWDDQQENAIIVAKQLCEGGATWRNQTEFLKKVHDECKRLNPQSTPDPEKVRRTLSINQDINDKRSLYRRFLTDKNFRAQLHKEYGPIQPSLDIDPSGEPS
ncbi:MAG: hypothetical protein AAGB23_02895 [Pseudomonadota bacterium]